MTQAGNLFVGATRRMDVWGQAGSFLCRGHAAHGRECMLVTSLQGPDLASTAQDL